MIPKNNLFECIINYDSKDLISFELLDLKVISHFSKESVVVVFNTLEEAEIYYDRLTKYINKEDILFFPFSNLGYEDYNNSFSYERLNCIYTLLQHKKIVITNIYGAFLKLYKKDVYITSIINIKLKSIIKLDSLIKKLVNIGYKKEQVVLKSGEFCVKGDIIDIFCFNSQYPYRIYFDFNTVSLIKEFDVDDQLTKSCIDNINILPICEILSPDLDNKFNTSNLEYINDYTNIIDLFNLKAFFIDIKNNLFSNLFYTKDYKNLNVINNNILYCNQDKYFIGNLFLKFYKKKTIILSSRDDSYTNEISNLLKEYDIYINNKDIILNYENLPSYEFLDFVIINIEVLGRNENIKKNSKFKAVYRNSKKVSHFDELIIDSKVVHYDYGIGIYKGIKQIEKDNVIQDYIAIEYLNKKVLYIKLNNINKIAKCYSDLEITDISKSSWQKSVNKIKDKLSGIKDALIRLYNKRSHTLGFSFNIDYEMLEKLSKTFSYELTIDQKNAILDIISDMSKDIPMDRIICGDVGFGKTEVCLRAILIAYLNNKQTIFLSPTTILSNQHYNTVKKRLNAFGVRVGILNRFISKKEANLTLQNLSEGKIDVLICTHKIFMSNSKFYDLGLLIIDEEQRFGVSDKEKIKELKVNIDSLYLSATPIPRTLYMGLSKLKDISYIKTPPKDRVSVSCELSLYSDDLVKNVILNEILRGGQVFYLYNSVETILNKVSYLKELLPNLDIRYIHGRLDKVLIEDTMNDFILKKFDVLVCTTIIESGIDIPNVNTLIIEKAYMLGLSQLYQLKGRVGRSDKIAYCYMLYDKSLDKNSISYKRLESILKYQDLGSGSLISYEDMSQRGYGDILGESQSGFIEDVGIEMYLKILKDSLEENTSSYEKINFTFVSESIDSSYIESEDLRIMLHKRIDLLYTYSGYFNLINELVDRFGSIPNSLIYYIKESLIKNILVKYNISFTNNIATFSFLFKKEFFNDFDLVLFTKKALSFKSIQIESSKDNIILYYKKLNTNIGFINDFFDFFKDLLN